jgi:uncharacterized protein YqeY
MLKNRIQEDVKEAMKAKNKDRLGTLRLITAEIKQREVDERSELDNSQILAILDKMIKQRRDAIVQYEKAGRQELADQEKREIAVIETYLPESLSEHEITAMIEDAIKKSGASSMREMGKIIGMLKPKLQGRADMGKVSAQIKQRLNN